MMASGSAKVMRPGLPDFSRASIRTPSRNPSSCWLDKRPLKPRRSRCRRGNFRHFVKYQDSLFLTICPCVRVCSSLSSCSIPAIATPGLGGASLSQDHCYNTLSLAVIPLARSLPSLQSRWLIASPLWLFPLLSAMPYADQAFQGKHRRGHSLHAICTLRLMTCHGGVVCHVVMS